MEKNINNDTIYQKMGQKENKNKQNKIVKHYFARQIVFEIYNLHKNVFDSDVYNVRYEKQRTFAEKFMMVNFLFKFLFVFRIWLRNDS